MKLKLGKYLKESFHEMKKVAWPSKAKIVSYTGIVLLTSLAFAVLLGLIDFGLSEVVKALAKLV